MTRQTSIAMPISLLFHARPRPFFQGAGILRLMLTIPALAALLPHTAQAAPWLNIGSKPGVKIEIDSGSLERINDDKFRIWHREIYAKRQIPDSGAFSYSKLTAFTEFQCTKRLATPLRRTYFAPGGSELQSENFDGKEQAPVVPDSVSEVVFNHACKEKLWPEPAIVETPQAPAAPVDNSKTSKKKGKAGKDEAPPPPPPPPPPRWDYEGKAGAAKWGKLSSDYATCGLGLRQSPIDIHETISADLPPVRFSYKPVSLSIIDDGHTIQVNTAGAGSIKVDTEEFELLQFHFHKPSEEKINGKTYDMSVHLVHKSKEGKVAVVAVMLQAGKEQQLIRTLWSNLPLEQNKLIDRTDIKIDPTLLLPATRNYFTYIGSLSTPPCSEGVLWLVFKTPTQLSKEQIAGFGRIYNNNTRPIQPRNARVIKESR
jgi:carbonic anhydrase